MLVFNLIIIIRIYGTSHQTTSCSSDVGSSSSPDYESFPLIKSETVVCDNFVLNNRLRARNTIFGGSMRAPRPTSGCHPHPSLRNSIRIRPPPLQGPSPEEDIYSLCGSERGIDVPSPLIPNGSIRHTRSVSNAMSSISVTTVNRASYALSKQSSKAIIKPPPPYPGRVMVSFMLL
uniref:Uncharacterized protein n=2 Tax=Panagrolaimus superbus TaxID=310955 RepID=A0A914YUW6_9BILA